VFDFADPAVPGLDGKNRWPANLPGFRDSMVSFFDAFSVLADRTLALLHQTLELSADGRARIVSDRRGSTVRLNHYPLVDPVPNGEREDLPDLGESALGYHTDPGVLTLLLQDDTGGLQTQSARDGWIDVPPIPGTVVVNLADCMQSWTNDRWRAAVHRVVPMTRKRRFSIPYFSNPTRDAVIEPVPELCERGPRYRAVSWRAFIRARTDDNFTDLGADDTQMAQYRIDAGEPA
jgi:isopenicillin N synthase-like dioxygenase